jgi:hypothetical protein
MTVNTSLGPLTFDHGYPLKDTVTMLYDALDFQRATQAYLWDCPSFRWLSGSTSPNRRLGPRTGTS